MVAFLPWQMFHLLGISLLGGMVLLGDLRLLNLVMKDVPSEVVIENTYKWFNVALVMVVISGVFMSSAVALKLYYNSMFWAKMACLGAGVFFVYAIRRPLLRFDHTTIKPMTLRLIAISSILLWLPSPPLAAGSDSLSRPLMKEQDTLEKVAIGFAAVTLFGLVWFWAVQVGWVIETLEMAYG